MEDFIRSLVYVKSNDLICPVEKKWFEQKFKNDPTEFQPIKSIEVMNALRDYARKLYEQDIQNYNTFREKTRRSDHNWIKTVLKTGTLGDKISANCILVQDSAIHNLQSLEHLMSSVKLSKKRECMLAIDAIKDLFANYLLPKQAALKSFHEHPFEILPKLDNDKTGRDKRLILWYFESLLKISYNNFIKALQLVYQDTLTTTKFKVTSTMFDLIAANPQEQVRQVLETIINKLGDPEYKVASRIIYDIKNFLTKCPKMKINVLVEIERLVSRQNINQRAQYYGFCCMNQFVLKKQDTEVANRLLLIYFSFFKKFIKNKEIDSRMLGALLTGVNRAYKFAKSIFNINNEISVKIKSNKLINIIVDHEEIDKNLNTLFKLVHVTSFNVSMQALMLLNQVIDSRDDMIHRYYNALYRKMFDLEWRNTSKQTFFLNLLFNSLKKDEAIPRIKAFIKRLLQICFSQNVPFVCGSFMLISELMKLRSNIFQFDSTLLSQNQPQTQINDKFNDDDEEEKFKDVRSDSEPDNEDSDSETTQTKETQASWVHKRNIIFKKHDKYDYQERNPLYAGADKTLTFELLAFTKHYHPTVVVFANKLINNQPVEYTGDPMEDFTLIHFLDRFVYKNPKKTKTNKDKPVKKSIFEPVKSIYKSSVRNLPVNSKEYLNLDYNQIPEEEKFFYNYYKSQQEKKNKLDIDSDAESVSDSEFDEYLAKTEVDGADGSDDWTLDFAKELKKKKGNEKKKKSKEASEDEDGFDDMDEDIDNDDDDDIDEDELIEDFENDEEFQKEMNSDDDQEDDFENDDNFDQKTGMIKMTNKKRRKEDINDLFAAADEFTDLINESSRYDEMGVGSISNKDNANPKQLKWEMMRDFNHKRRGGSHKGGKRFNKKNKKTSKKLQNNSKNNKKTKTIKKKA